MRGEGGAYAGCGDGAVCGVGCRCPEMFALVDAINSYPNQDSRYVLSEDRRGIRAMR